MTSDAAARRFAPTHVLRRHVRATERGDAVPTLVVPEVSTRAPEACGLHRNMPMPSASLVTVDLPIWECDPPPIPKAALRPKRRRPATLVPGMRIGVWLIERELGRGGMATVYAAEHTRFGKRAALKLAHRNVLGPRFTPETFLREARIANLIDHPGVVEVFATGTFGGRPYLAMERLAGRSLGARLDDGALPRDEALEILIELCEVLSAAHAAGVTHRDLKLDNVFLLASPGAGGRRTKLLDWGMARIANEDDPMRGMIAGTLTYVAPEQVRGDEITPAADVYSLAVMAYQLLLGEPPFASANDLELLDLHLRAAPPRPRTRWAGIPHALEATLLAMLAKQPADRPSLAEVTQALRAARARVRPSKLRWLEPVAAVAAPVPAVIDVIGRPALPFLVTKRQRVAGAALGLALTAASILQLFIA
jgi:serine/threonine-protein kinase